MDQMEIDAVAVRMASESLSLSQARSWMAGACLLGISSCGFPCLPKIQISKFKFKRRNCLPVKDPDYPVLAGDCNPVAVRRPGGLHFAVPTLLWGELKDLCLC